MAGSRTRRYLPGTKAGTADERSGIRKRAEGGSKQGPGRLRDQGAARVAAARVTWSRGHVHGATHAPRALCACAVPGARCGAGRDWHRLRGALRAAAGARSADARAPRASVLCPAERLVRCLLSALVRSRTAVPARRPGSLRSRVSPGPRRPPACRGGLWSTSLGVKSIPPITHLESFF